MEGRSELHGQSFEAIVSACEYRRAKCSAKPEPAAGSADGEEPLVTETAKVEDVGEGEREGP